MDQEVLEALHALEREAARLAFVMSTAQAEHAMEEMIQSLEEALRELDALELMLTKVTNK